MSLCQKEKGQIGKILNPQSHSPAIYTLSLPTSEKKWFFYDRRFKQILSILIISSLFFFENKTVPSAPRMSTYVHICSVTTNKVLSSFADAEAGPS